MKTRKKTVVIIILVVSLLLVISAGVYTYIYISGLYDDETSDYHDMKVSGFIDENKDVHSCDILFLGDSLTDGYDYNIPYYEYFSLNRGIGGDRTADLIEMLDVAVYAVDPEVVVLLIGGNDVLAGKPEWYIMENLEVIIDGIQQNTRAKIVIQSFYPLGDRWAVHNETMLSLNEKVNKLASEKGCTFVDMYTLLVDNETGEFKSEYTMEGVHLSDAGRKVVVEALKPVVYNIVRAR